MPTIGFFRCPYGSYGTGSRFIAIFRGFIGRYISSCNVIWFIKKLTEKLRTQALTSKNNNRERCIEKDQIIYIKEFC